MHDGVHIHYTRYPKKKKTQKICNVPSLNLYISLQMRARLPLSCNNVFLRFTTVAGMSIVRIIFFRFSFALFPSRCEIYFIFDSNFFSVSLVFAYFLICFTLLLSPNCFQSTQIEKRRGNKKFP